MGRERGDEQEEVPEEVPGEAVAAPGSAAALAAAVDALDVSVDGAELLAVLAARDRLEARLAALVSAFDAAELWGDEGATSMTRWLVTEARLDEPAARRLVRRATRLHAWPALAAAAAAGTISAGQVELVVTAVPPRHTARFADHETDLVPALALLDVADTATALRHWVEHADALDDAEPPEPARSTLRLHPVGDRSRLDGDLDGDATAIVAEALRLAGRFDDDTDPRPRTRSERDADALIDLCARYLRDHLTPKTQPGRQRPGVNIVIDAPDLAALELRELGVHDLATLDDWHATPALRAWYRAGLHRLERDPRAAARTLTGHQLSPALAAAFCCDSTMRRVLATGSTILEHGKAHATVPRAIRDATIVRDRHCRFRGCRRSVDWCEVHHLTHKANGGTDRLDNCVLLCAYHHHVLHRPGWSAHLTPDGALLVATPQGTTWTTRPPGPGIGPPLQPLTYGA